MVDSKVLLSTIVGQKHLLSGNEAIARGVVESGVKVATTYPGTPSSEIADNLARVAPEAGIYMEYSTNEIVAVEVAAGASLSGVRAFTCMKHVGLNVASDAFVTLAYIGVKGGYVIVSADDPNCWSSQNEQDNRYYALLANVPCIEPSNSQEAKDWTNYGFEISEKFELPILLRTTTRVNHTLAPVKLSQIHTKEDGIFIHDVSHFVMVPSFARERHKVLLDKISSIKDYNESSPFNKIVRNEGNFGIITSGASYNYVMESLDILGLEASVLKIGMSHPFPENLVKNFIEELDKIFIVEELEPYLENAVKSVAGTWGLKRQIYGKSSDLLPRYGELSTNTVTTSLAKKLGKTLPDYFTNSISYREIQEMLPPRPPILCPGCPHRASFYAMKKTMKNVDVKCTDIGCYALGIQKPLHIGDLLICMGASVGAACGISKVQHKPAVAIVGDSTFFHASLPGLINAVYNGHQIVLVVLDNYTTAMTGFQPHPGTGIISTGELGRRVVIEEVAKACGVEFVEVVNPYNVKQTTDVFKKALDFRGPSVIVSRQKCSLMSAREKHKKGEKVTKYSIIEEKCNQCKACINLLGCPAIFVSDEQVLIDVNLCTGCGVCAQICPHRAIEISEGGHQ